jgi:hypothetical protein
MFICVSIARLEHEDQNQAWNYDVDELDVLFSQPTVKVTKKEKQPWWVVASSSGSFSIYTPLFKSPYNSVKMIVYYDIIG